MSIHKIEIQENATKGQEGISIVTYNKCSKVLHYLRRVNAKIKVLTLIDFKSIIRIRAVIFRVNTKRIVKNNNKLTKKMINNIKN